MSSKAHCNVVVIGKSGAGKSTVANKLIGEEVFKVTGSLDVTTRMISHYEVILDHGSKWCHLKVVETIGLSNERLRNADTIAAIKRYFRDVFLDGISLVLFVFSIGRFTAEERACLETIIAIFRRDISPIMALVVTRCENMKAKSRADYVQQFQTNERSRDIAAFMGKGIFTVGFPDTSDMDEDEMLLIRKKMEADVAQLHDLVYSCTQMFLGKQLFHKW